MRGSTGGAGLATGLLLGLLALLAQLLRLRRGRRRRAAVRPGAGGQVVRSTDGTALHVEVDDAPQAPLTVVFVHGFTARLGEFAPQREALAGRARLVLYDQRGHGRSGRGPARHATFDQLGEDLAAVLEATTPRGPVVLVGHSMGGMTIMSFARQHPELLGDRVVGVFLLATSAGELTSAGPLGLWIRVLTRLRLLGAYLWWLRLLAPLAERFRRRGTATGRAVTRYLLFGRDDATPELVDQAQRMLEETPWTVTVTFYGAFLAHDEHATLPSLDRVPVTVLVGTHDRLTPARHSERIAAAIPGSRLVVVPGAGHSVNITRPAVVNDALVDLLQRAERHASGPSAARAAS